MISKLVSRVGIVLGVLAGSLAVAPSAHAMMMGAVRPSILGGINDTLNTGGAMGYTGGVDIGFGLGVAIDLTVGAEYLSRSFSVSGGGLTLSGNINYIHIPGILFIHLAPMISIGGGGFYDVAVTSGAAANFGVTGALRIRLGATPLYLEGRYNYGLDTSDQGENTSEIQGLLGLRF